MIEEKSFDYKDYIQRRLKDITDIDERRYAKELLLESLGEMFAWTEAKYKTLEQRIKNDLDNPWEDFNIFMTVVKRSDYDPINNFWHPVCSADIASAKEKKGITVYLMADDAGCQRFFNQGIIEAVDSVSGNRYCYHITKSERYKICMERTYKLFTSNHIPWQTIQLGHLERFFDLVPDKDIPSDAQPVFQWKDWEAFIHQDIIPLWNMQRKMLQSQEFRHPCIDEVIYEHIYYLGDENNGGDGCLIDAEEDILSIRYENNKVILKTKAETIGDVSICRLHQGDQGNSYGYHYAVLSNHRKDNIAARYLQQSGNFIQTPMELRRKIEELSGSFSIRAASYEIVSSNKENILDKGILEGNMNHFIGTQVFTQDQRSLLVFYFQKEGQALCDYLNSDYLYESQIRYILSQLQMEFLEYKCVGVLE